MLAVILEIRMSKDAIMQPVCFALYTIRQYAGTWKQASPERTRTSFRWFWSEAKGSHISFSCLTSRKRFFHSPASATVWSFLVLVCEFCNPTVAW